MAIKIPYQDKQGKWRDSKGRFTKLRPSEDKKVIIFKDKRGRWRDIKGGFTKLRPAEPTIEIIVPPRDIKGKFIKVIKVRVKVPVSEVPSLPVPTLPLPKPKLVRERVKVPVYRRRTGDVEHYREGTDDDLVRFMNCSKGNREDPSSITEKGEQRVPMVFEKSFIGTLNKTPFEADEIAIFRYGLSIRPKEAMLWSESLEERLQEILEPYPGASIHVVDEADTFSIRINLGNRIRPTSPDDISEDLANTESMLGDIYFEIEQTYGNTDWFVFWDTDIEMIYEF